MSPTDPKPGDLSPVQYPTGAVDPWNWQPDAGWSPERNLIGYHVKATDGNVGKVAMASHAQDESYLVVNTGPWMFGSTLVVPAGVVSVVDHSQRNVHLNCSKALVKSAPAYKADHGKFPSPADWDKLADYYRAELSR